jgi:enoyl-CoA hydratase
MAVELTRVEEFALITLNRPEALNALSFSIIRELGAAFDAAAASDARALFITGAGPKAFCAGADIKELIGNSPDTHHAGVNLGQQIFAKLDSLPIPSIALINGYAFGGGLELALACTFRLASRTAKMALPEIKLGLIPAYGGTQRLPRVIGESRALEMILSGRNIDAAEAERIGLINRLVDSDLLAAGIEFARSFSGHSLATSRLARQAVHRGLAGPLEQGFEIEAAYSTQAYQTEDAKEGIRAFAEKRKATFRDR